MAVMQPGGGPFYFWLLPFFALLPHPVLIPTPLRLAEPAVLLVLLPNTAAGTAPLAVFDDLQRRLGTAIRVLSIDETSHPTVVDSFAGRTLPAFVLLRHGVELWHQQGLPEGELIAELLLSKLYLAGAIGA